MTPEQRREFESQGLTCLRQAVSPEVARSIRDRLWQHTAEKLGISEDDPDTWRRVPPAIVKEIKESEGLFDPILGPVTSTALDALLGEGRWRRPEHPGQLIMTPPDAHEWLVPHQMWRKAWAAQVPRRKRSQSGPRISTLPVMAMSG